MGKSANSKRTLFYSSTPMFNTRVPPPCLLFLLGPRMMFLDCTKLLSQFHIQTARTEKLYYIGTLGVLASCHGTAIRGAFWRLARSGVLHSLVSVRATTCEVRLAEYLQPTPSPGEMRSHVAKLVSTSATKSGAEVALPSLPQSSTLRRP